MNTEKVKEHSIALKKIGAVVLVSVLVSFGFIGTMQAISKILIPVELQVSVTQADQEIADKAIDENTNGLDDILGTFSEWITFDDVENVTHIPNNLEVENDLIVNGLGGNILAGDRVLLTSTADATETCGVYKDLNETGKDILLTGWYFDSDASTTPTSSVIYHFDILPSRQASTSIAKTDALANNKGSYGSTTVVTSSKAIYDSSRLFGYAGNKNNATSWPEDYYLCINASGTQGKIDTSAGERYICGGDNGGCNDASTTVNYGYFQWFGIELH